MSISRKILYAVAAGIVFNLTGCSSGSSSSSGTTSPAAVQIQGVVSAPGSTTGTIAFAQPDSSFKSMLAAMFLPHAHAAAITGTAPVGAGAIVELIEIDNTGAKVGSTIASTTTAADGSYTLNAPSTFAAATKYVVRVTSSSDATKYLDSIVTSTSVDVDPATDITKTLVINAVSGVGISSVTPEAVAEIQSTVEDLGNEIDSAAFTDLATTKSLLAAQSTNDEEASNIVSSIVSSGVISGTVKDINNSPLPNIKIVVRDFNNWVTRAVTRTDASGAYTVHVPAGDYIMGALNMTGTSTAASEWWTASGGVANQFSADKTTVATTTVTRDFVLDPGVRISGTVTGAGNSLPVRGIQIQLRDYINDQPVGGVQTGIDGTYRINVRPGNYTAGAYNTTFQPYATQLYNSTLSNGGTNATQAEKITLAPGTPKTANFSLLAGRIISGAVTDGAGVVVPGMAVRFYTSTGAFVRGVRTNKLGKYRLWLLPNATGQSYVVRSRGQTNSANLDTASQTTGQDFTTAMGTITATLSDGTNPVSQTKVHIYDSTGFLGFEVSNSDGSVVLYAAAPVKVQPVIDNGTFLGTQFSNGVKQTSTASLIAVGTAMGTITLPAGGVLSGTVNVGTTPTGDRLVQVRSGGTAAINYLINTRTQLDGSYSISLPAGSYNVRACNPADAVVATGCGNTATWAAGTGAGQYSVPAITASGTTTLNLTAPN